MALKIFFYPRARKELQGLPKADRDRVLQRLQAYAADPDNPHHAVVALVGKSRSVGCVWGIGVYYSTALTIR